MSPAARPGLSVPGSSAPYRAAPHEPTACDARTPREAPGRLRRSLRASTAEGITAEVVMACAGGAAITGWALQLGCGPLLVGLIGALPFLAQLLQLPGAWLTARLGARRAAILTGALSRQAFWPLALLPLLPLSLEGKQLLLVGVAAAHHALGILCNNAWVAWMGELVPARVRGRYFGQRTALCTLAGALCALGVGLALDGAGPAQASLPVLALLALGACLAGAVSTVLMALKHSPAGAAPLVRVDLRAWVRPLRDGQARRFLAYQLAWNAAVGLGAPFLALYLLQDLRLGFALMALHGTGTAAARILCAPRWGRVVDRFGARPVLVCCSFGMALSPLLWTWASPGFLWPIALDALLVGVLVAGHGVASFALPLAVAPRRERPFYHAAFALTGGVAYAAGSLTGGSLSQAAAGGFTLLGHAFSALHLPFLLSALARVAGALVAGGLAEPGARSVRQLLQGAGAGLGPRLQRARRGAAPSAPALGRPQHTGQAD